MKNKRIPSIGPSITKKEIKLVTDAVRRGWYQEMTLHIDKFVREFELFTNKKYCLPTSHGTAAIHLSLLALNIGPGDEVIVPDISWVASAAPIEYVGAKIVFVDIDPENWCISPDAFEKAITKKTKAVVVVDLFGNMPDMKKICKIATRYNVKIIEDAAEAIGAEYEGKLAGTFGETGVFSFNATKLVISGQGGMLVTDNKEVYEKAKLFSHHGIDKSPGSKYYWSNVIGFNYNWTNIQAALALAQLRRINELVNKRRKIFEWYKERLGTLDGIRLNAEANNVKNTFWISTAIIDKRYSLTKEMIQEEFKKYNIDARPFFYPISMMPPYKKYCKTKNMAKENPVSYEFSKYGICLPSGSNLTESDVDYVSQCFKKIILKTD